MLEDGECLLVVELLLLEVADNLLILNVLDLLVLIMIKERSVLGVH